MLADGADGVRELVRKRVRSGSTLIKIGLSKGNDHDRTLFPVWGEDPYDVVLSMTPEEIEAVTHEAHVNKLKVSAHCIGDGPVNAALDFGVDTIEHGFGISDETRRRLVTENALVVTTLCAMHMLREGAESWGMSARHRKIMQRHIDVQRADFEKGLEAGVRYALGTDLVGSPTHPNDIAALEFELAVEAGMDPARSIVAGTAIGAEALGMEKSIGTLEVGKLADMIAFTGNPLRDITVLQRIEFVLQGGEVVVGIQSGHLAAKPLAICPNSSIVRCRSPVVVFNSALVLANGGVVVVDGLSPLLLRLTKSASGLSGSDSSDHR